MAGRTQKIMFLPAITDAIVSGERPQESRGSILVVQGKCLPHSHRRSYVLPTLHSLLPTFEVLPLASAAP
ncbi:MAG TPA: hypothetical protein V6C85_21820 [Allocoleopsis sp.]